ncbi:hypothetical protein U1Q18_011976 [Sarracenia purpurea var. burkii]
MANQPSELTNTVFNESIHKLLPQIKDEPQFTWPSKMTRNPNKTNTKLRFSYHIDHGHLTKHCKQLKGFFEDQVKADHLDKYIDKEKIRAEVPNTPNVERQ